jgi:RNA polymerase sigma-70 factor (ECF subfamily)
LGAVSDKHIQSLLSDESTREKVFSEIVRQNQEQIYYFIRRMVLDHDDANDVAQNTFIKAWKGISTFRGEARISTWLCRIAYNESITFLNKKKKIAGVSLSDVEHSLSQNLEADVYYNGDEMQKKLQTAIARLPEKQKAVFIMKYYEDKKYLEISEITGTSVGALKASYHHAVQKIEKFLTED